MKIQSLTLTMKNPTREAQSATPIEKGEIPVLPTTHVSTTTEHLLHHLHI